MMWEVSRRQSSTQIIIIHSSKIQEHVLISTEFPVSKDG